MRFFSKLHKPTSGGLLSKSLVTAVMKVGGIILSFIAAAIVARNLGAAEYGIFSLAFVFSSVLGIIVQFGIPNLALRETARANNSGDITKLKHLLSWTTWRLAQMSTLILVLAGIFVYIYFDGFGSKGATAALVALALLPLVAFDAVRSAILRGLGFIALGQFSSLLLRPALFIALVLIAVLFAQELDAISAMVLRVAAATITLLFVIVAFRTLAPTLPEGIVPSDPETKKQWMSTSISMGLIAGMTQITNYADILLLGIFVPVDDVGRYRVAYQLSTLVVFGLKAISMVSAPAFAKTSAIEKRGELQKMVRSASRLSCLVAIVSAIFLIAFGKYILDIVFGPDFSGAYFVLVLLVLGQALNAYFGPIGILMSMVGFEKVAANIMMGAALLNIALNLALIPIYGVTGAAVATIISFAFWNIAMWYTLRSKAGIRSDPFSRNINA